jgi:leader peptidase (prepilin peptidase)/N-methyltransferase
MMHDAVLAIHAHAPWAWPLLGGVLGAVLGSFAACMAERVQRKEGLRYPPSHCPACQTVLRVPDLIPIVSWLWRRGCCGYCGVGIPKRLLMAEVLGAALGAALMWILLH